MVWNVAMPLRLHPNVRANAMAVVVAHELALGFKMRRTWQKWI